MGGVHVAHSLNRNAGQHYASARKRGVRGEELARLRAGMTNRKSSVAGELYSGERKELQERVRRANEGRQQSWL